MMYITYSTTWRRLSRIASCFIALSILFTAVPSFGQQAAPEAVRAREFAFYGTNFADWAVVDLSGATGSPITWKVLKNPANPAPGQAQISNFVWGIVGDVLTPGSWTGDSTYDPGIWRSGTYWRLRWETPTIYDATLWGATTDNMGREGDYDGDGIIDMTALRISSNILQWWIRLSSTGTQRVVNFGSLITGQSTFAFRGADFTGDGRDELIIARAVNATGVVTWFVADAVTGTQIKQVQWGNFNTHFIVNPADYTGDGRADFVTWAAGEADPVARKWWILDSQTGAILPPIQWGMGDPTFEDPDLPIRGDYDGDGIHDICVWRPSNTTYYCRASSNGSMIAQQWGAPTDTPLATFFTF